MSQSIRETVARAVASTQRFAWGLNYDTALEEDQDHCGEIADAAIRAFLDAAAEQGWRMVPDEATEEMTGAVVSAAFEALDNDRMNEWNGTAAYRAMRAAAPKFEWDK